MGHVSVSHPLRLPRCLHRDRRHRSPRHPTCVRHRALRHRPRPPLRHRHQRPLHCQHHPPRPPPQRHSQSVFAHALSRHRLALRLAHRAADHAVARVHACTLRGAAALLLCYRIPPGTLLSDAEFTFFVCHRLGIPIPLALVAAAAILRCTPKCRTITAAKPLTAAHALFPLHQHCLHQLTCGASSLRLRRHNNLARCAATTLAAEASLEASLTTNLHSSLTSNTRVDLLLTSALAEQDTAIDFTVSCPLLPTYLPIAVRDPTDII